MQRKTDAGWRVENEQHKTRAFLSLRFAVMIGRDIVKLFEKTDITAHVVITEGFADIIDSHIGVFQHFLGFFRSVKVQVFR